VVITKASVRRFQLKIDEIAYKVRERLPLNAYRKHEILQSELNGSYVINFGRAGFFSNFFEVLGYALWCERNCITPLAYGGRFCNDTYRRNLYWAEEGYNGARNVWEYFFEPLSGKSINCFLYPDNFGRNTREYIFAPDGSGIGLTKCVTPAAIAKIENERREELNLPAVSLSSGLEQFSRTRGYAKVWRMLAYQRDYPSCQYRRTVNEIICKYVKIKPNVQARVDRFYDMHMAGKEVVGLHVRSTDNVNSEHRPIDLARYCHLIDSHSSTSLIYVATDSAKVLAQLKERYANRLLCGACERSHDGKPVHTNHTKRVTCGNPLLGEQVLSDAILLSKTSFFVHGLSGVASAALFFNPDLAHRSVWDGLS